MMTATDDLTACPIFDGLTGDQQRDLMSRMTLETFPADSAILTESQQSRGLWIIKRGRCQVIKAMPDGTSRSLAELGSGAIFGEMSFFQPAPASATVRSMTETEVWGLTTDEYFRLEKEAPIIAHKIAFAISLVLAERMRWMDDWISRCLGGQAPEKRQEWSEFRAKLYTNWDF